MSPERDLIGALARNVVESGYDRIPGAAVKAAKLGFLDTVGVLLAGSVSPGCQAVIDLAREWGGKPESTILVHGGKVPAGNAAMANSVMARALDFDYVFLKGLHLGASSIPTALAMAERRGGASGKEVLAAIIAGEDLALRIHWATAYPGFDPTGVAMVFGTAAIAGKLLGFSEPEMIDALGIAFNRAGGSFQSNIDASLAVRVIQGFTSRNGIESALLAQKGITGVINVLGGVWGYFNLFSKSPLDAALITDGLGQDYWTSRIWFKRFPCCGGTLSCVDAALELAEENPIDPGRIKEVTVKVFGNATYQLVGKPFEIRRYPQVDAQFSIAYTVANALLRKSATLQDFQPESVRNAEVVALAGKVRTVIDKEVKEMGGRHGSSIVEVVMEDGSRHCRFVKSPRGLADNPLTEEEIRHKFADCVEQAPVRLPKRRLDRLVKMIDNLEDVEDVREIVDLLVVK